MLADFALGVLSRHKVDVQPAALEFVNGLVGEGNFTGVRNLACTEWECKESRTQVGNEVC